MDKFNIHDMVQIIDEQSLNYECITRVVGIKNNGWCVVEGGLRNFSCQEIPQTSLRKILNLKFKLGERMNIADKVKQIRLNKDDKVLRKYGMQDDCGRWTNDAENFLMTILLDERKSDLVKVAQELEADEKASAK